MEALKTAADRFAEAVDSIGYGGSVIRKLREAYKEEAT